MRIIKNLLKLAVLIIVLAVIGYVVFTWGQM
jgi:hypothetical protein